MNALWGRLLWLELLSQLIGFTQQKALGLECPMRNSMDAVSDRDFVLEFMSDSAISMVHFSRLAEELILWGSIEFDFISLPDPVGHWLFNNATEEKPRCCRAH